MEEATLQDRLEATVRDKEGVELKIQIAEEAGHDERVAELKDELKAVNASIRALGAKAKKPSERADKR